MPLIIFDLSVTNTTNRIFNIVLYVIHEITQRVRTSLSRYHRSPQQSTTEKYDTKEYLSIFPTVQRNHVVQFHRISMCNMDIFSLTSLPLKWCFEICHNYHIFNLLVILSAELRIDHSSYRMKIQFPFY